MIESYPDTAMRSSLVNSVLKPSTTIRDEDPYYITTKKCESQAVEIHKEHVPRLKKLSQELKHLIKGGKFIYDFMEKNHQFNVKFFKALISKEKNILNLMKRGERNVRLSDRNKNLNDSLHFSMLMEERTTKKKKNVNKLNTLNNLLESIETKFKRNFEKEKGFKEKMIVLKKLKKDLPYAEKKFINKIKTVNKAFKDVISNLGKNNKLHEKNKSPGHCSLEKMLIFLRRLVKSENYAYEVVDNLHKQFLVARDRIKYRGNTMRELMAEYINYLQECYTVTPRLVKARQAVMDFDLKSLSEAKFNESWYLNPPKLNKKDFEYESFFEMKAKMKQVRLPKEFFFSQFDHFNTKVMIKKEKDKAMGNCVRIFNSIDGVVYIYIVRKHSEVPMHEPKFYCKQENVIFSSGGGNGKISFKEKAMFMGKSFEFDNLSPEDGEVKELFEYFLNIGKKKEEEKKVEKGVDEEVKE